MSSVAESSKARSVWMASSGNPTALRSDSATRAVCRSPGSGASACLGRDGEGGGPRVGGRGGCGWNASGEVDKESVDAPAQSASVAEVCALHSRESSIRSQC